MARILLVHGAFGRAACWDRVAPGLRAAGHTVEAIDLPGAGEDPTPVAEVTLDRYAQRVCEALAEGPPAVLVGHSMGGMVITQAAARCPEQDRAAGVRRGVPAAGRAEPDRHHAAARGGGRPGAGEPRRRRRSAGGDDALPRRSARRCVTAATTSRSAWSASLRGRQPVAPFTHPVALGGPKADAFAALPRAYVTCLQDRAIKPAIQRRMFEAAGCDPVIEIDTDHAVWASRPDELAAALNRIVGCGEVRRAGASSAAI